MNCEDFREFLDEEPDAEHQARMFAHAARCPDCLERLEFESLMHRQLRTLPIPAPRAGFADRVLAQAHRAVEGEPRQRRPSFQPHGWVWAMAASCVLALGLWLSAGLERHAEPEVAQVALGQPTQVQPVRLLFRSAESLSGVTIALALPEGVEIAGYPGQRELSWRTDLQSGPNLLELPVLVSGDGGMLTATLWLGQERRQFSVKVQGAASSGALMRPGVSELERGRGHV
jgi:hypothetical protein